PLVVVVNRHRQFLLGLLLADYVLIEKTLYFLRLGQLIGGGGGRRRGAVIFQDGIADRHALVAYVRPGIIAGGRNKLGHCVLRLVAERTAQHLLGASPVFHSALL